LLPLVVALRGDRYGLGGGVDWVWGVKCRENGDRRRETGDRKMKNAEHCLTPPLVKRGLGKLEG
jgi:hypothetical protein